MSKTDTSRPFNMIQDYRLLFELMTTNHTPGLSKAQQVEGFAVLFRMFSRMPVADQKKLTEAVRKADGEVFEGVILKHSQAADVVTPLKTAKDK